MTARSAAAALALAAMLALSSCAAEAPPAAETPAPTVTVTVSPSPEPEVALGDFGFTYFGAATIDAADVAALEAQLGAAVDVPAECPWYPMIASHGTYAETRAFFDSRGVTPGVRFFYTLEMGDDGVMPRTVEGVGVGSTEAEVLAAYPSAVIDNSFEDVSLGPIKRIIVDDPASDSKYVFGLFEGDEYIGILQWGPDAGGQWAHLCLPL
ncbi:MAG: hypothetical protein KIT89_06070 [Microcella sp.]|uniref:hypothetical protein n=1 Tax=Microcella sp. TaxID=1913979 RepID=UPI0024CB7AA9|nr:hypothetical protein [Microcella sp.]UYN84726.1 MAG: hypothetical protein KIT89_06070 [Microcella sp.]